MLLSTEIQAIAKQIAVELGNADDKLLTTADVAKLLGKTPAAVRKLCERGRLPHHKHYGTLYFSSVELKKHLLQ